MIAKTKKYFQDIQNEWTKVSKPEWKEVRGNSLVVITATAILIAFLWLVDGADQLPVGLEAQKKLLTS